jgi:cytochrome P450
MSFVHTAPLITRPQHELPPAAPLPAALQTLACRWWPFDYVQRCRARYGERFTIRPVDMPPLVFLSDPQEIRAVLTAPPDVLHPGDGGAVMAPLFGESSFAVREADEHASGRDAIVPAFDREVVQRYAGMIAAVAGSEIASWPVDTALPLDTLLQKLTMRVMLRTVIGGEDSACQTLQEPLLGMLSVMESFVLQEPRLRHLPGWRRTWERFVERRDEVDELIFALIDRRRHEDDPGSDLLGMLLGAHNLDGSPMSDRQVRDSLVSVIIAGHETTAATLAWAFQLLAHNPTVQERLSREIDDGVGDEYMNATIQETLRHKPAFLFVPPRTIVKPIEIGSWTYQPPAQLLGCTYLMHHNPELYPDPHTFRPERFLGETPQAGTWLPWGAGRKRCPGRHLALLEIQTVLREALWTRLVLPAGDRIERPRWRSVILTPHAGSRVILRKRRSEPHTARTQAHGGPI